MIDRTSVLPLYYQLKTAIDTRIHSGEWPAGTRTPSERELCAQFGVSRITVRRAVEQLVAVGRLRRVQGRGTYVTRPHGEYQPGGTL
jgi:GntR family transcriptional regulator